MGRWIRRELDKSVTARVPTRTNHDDRYFTDRSSPCRCTATRAMFERMLDHPNINVQTGIDWRDVRRQVPLRRAGLHRTVDEYLRLPLRQAALSLLRFRHETLDAEQFQPVGTVNYPDETTPYTRMTEFKH